MSEFQFTHTDTVDDVHTYDVAADTLTAAKRDATAWLGATYGAVKLIGRRGEYVVTATHGRQTFGTVTVERIEDKAPAGPVCAACNGDATCVARNAHHGVVSFAPAPIVYTVAYNDERGNSSERTFTNRADAVILFHETAGIDYAGFPADDSDAFEHIGWATETQELRGVTHIAEYTPERGNWNVTLYVTVDHAPMDVPAPTFPWPTAPMDGDYTGGRPLPELGDVVMTHRWRGGVRDVEASPATVVEGLTGPDARVVRFADGKEQAAFGYDMEPVSRVTRRADGATGTVREITPDGWIVDMDHGTDVLGTREAWELGDAPTGARVIEANGRTFEVIPDDGRTWTVTELGGPVGQREEDIVHDVILDGFADRSEGVDGETPVVLDLVDFTDPAAADQAGVKPGAYVREANDYGQRVTYRFATREAANRYMDEISSDF